MWYGDKKSEPVLALHGMQDNAATWSALVPHLQMTSLLCLDLPGHGQSSHLPPGLTLHYLDNILFLRYLLDKHYKYNTNLTLLGHSFGASLWFVYSALFPNEVSRLISIESALFNMMRDPEKLAHDMSKSIDSFIALESTSRAPQTYDELLKYMVETRQRNFPVSEKGCKALLSRNLTPVGDKFIFSRDPRLNIRFLGNLTADFILELSTRLKCKLLNIRAEDGIPTGSALKVCRNSLDLVKKSNRHVLDVFVPGGHHVHLEQPEHVAPVINKFLAET